GTTIFVIEQNVNMALSIAHRGYVLQDGRGRADRHRGGATRESADPEGLPRECVARRDQRRGPRSRTATPAARAFDLKSMYLPSRRGPGAGTAPPRLGRDEQCGACWETTGVLRLTVGRCRDVNAQSTSRVRASAVRGQS